MKRGRASRDRLEAVAAVAAVVVTVAVVAMAANVVVNPGFPHFFPESGHRLVIAFFSSTTESVGGGELLRRILFNQGAYLCRIIRVVTKTLKSRQSLKKLPERSPALRSAASWVPQAQ